MTILKNHVEHLNLMNALRDINLLKQASDLLRKAKVDDDLQYLFDNHLAGLMHAAKVNVKEYMRRHHV